MLDTRRKEAEPREIPKAKGAITSILYVLVNVLSIPQ